jgi:pimeloyl-ACP methyl ester carboxylesterase
MAWPAYAMGEDISTETRKIQVPVLVIAAAKDMIEPLERVQREVLHNIPGAQLTILSNSGHLSPFDQPVDLASSITGFIQRLNVSLCC